MSKLIDMLVNECQTCHNKNANENEKNNNNFKTDGLLNNVGIVKKKESKLWRNTQYVMLNNFI